MKTFSGKVVAGDKKGRLLGFPTINIEGEYDLPFGIYASKVTTSLGIYKGALHYGPRPVFGDIKPVMEVHLLDFEGDLYGTTVTIEIVDRLRDVQNFKSIKALKAQIQKDVDTVRSLVQP